MLHCFSAHFSSCSTSILIRGLAKLFRLLSGVFFPAVDDHLAVFGVEFHAEHEPVITKAAAGVSKRAKAAVASLAVAGPLSISTDVEMRPPADMMGKAGTVPLVIPMSAVHQHVPVAPSTQRTKDETAALKCRAPQYSGTLPYTPPEVAPKLADGARFLTARDYQPGDMWALGIVLANVLGGSGIRQAHPPPLR